MKLTQAHLDRLVCPVCFAPLVLAGGVIVCAGCGRRYPIVDGLPVLLPGRAALPGR